MKFENNFIVIIVAAVGIYSIFLFMSDYNILSQKIINFHIEYLIPILLIVTVSWVPLNLKWYYLLKKNGINIPFRKSVLIWLSGSALIATPGQIGELIKVQLLKKMYNVPRTKTASLVLLEKFYGLIGAFIAANVGIILFEINFTLIIFTCIILTVIFFFIYYKPIFEFVLNKAKKIKFFIKYTDNVSESYETLRNSTNPTTAFICIFLSFSYWIIISVSVYLTLLAFNIETITFLETISIYTSSVIIGIISFIPGGLGITEGSLLGLFTLKGIDVSFALTLIVVIRLTTLWYSVSIGFIGLKLTGGLSLSRNFEN